jgi:hypothetical protein
VADAGVEVSDEPPKVLPYAAPDANREGRGIGRRRRVRQRATTSLAIATVICALATVGMGMVGAAMAGAGHGTYSVLKAAGWLALLTLGLGSTAVSLLISRDED